MPLRADARPFGTAAGGQRVALDPQVPPLRLLRTLCWLLGFTVLSARLCAADTLTLAWDPNPEPDVAGYYVFIGTASGVYDTVVDVSNTTSFNYTSAQPGRTYYMTVAAYVAGPTLGPHAPEVVASIAGSAPVLLNPGNRSGTVGDSVSLTLSASDPDGDAVSFAATGLPLGLGLQSTTGLISGTLSAPGTFPVTVTATDPAGNAATQLFSWTVLPGDVTPPTISVASPTSASVVTSSDFLTVSGTAADDTGVTSVTWAANGGTGAAAGTTSWSVIVGLPVGTSTITMTARDAAGHSTSTNLSVTRQTQTAPLSLTSLTADKPAPQLTGTTITFAAVASGGTAPYQFKWRVFNGSSWSVLQGWSTSATFVWKPSKANSSYVVEVWARSATSTADAPDSASAKKSLSFPISDVPRVFKRRR